MIFHGANGEQEVGGEREREKETGLYSTELNGNNIRTAAYTCNAQKKYEFITGSSSLGHGRRIIQNSDGRMGNATDHDAQEKRSVYTIYDDFLFLFYIYKRILVGSRSTGGVAGAFFFIILD